MIGRSPDTPRTMGRSYGRAPRGEPGSGMSLEVIERPLEDPKVRRCILRILGRNQLCAIATVTSRGGAYINSAYFAYTPDLVFYFYSYPDTRHAVNLRANSSMAMAVFDSGQAWGRPDRGLQLFGAARAAVGPSARTAERTYDRRFPDHAAWKAPVVTDESAAPPRAFQFRPTTVKLFDERAFGAGIFVRAAIPRRRATETPATGASSRLTPRQLQVLACSDASEPAS